MKKWNFKVKSNVKEISKKLDTTLGSANGFDFNLDTSKNDSTTFKVQKRGLYAFYLIYLNKIIVNGKILKTNTENETHIEISFTQYFLWKMVIFTYFLLGLGYLIAIIAGIINTSVLLIPVLGVLLAVGVVILIAIQKKFEKDTQEYKKLISNILEF
jgi:hypothetical protein